MVSIIVGDWVDGRVIEEDVTKSLQASRCFLAVSHLFTVSTRFFVFSMLVSAKEVRVPPPRMVYHFLASCTVFEPIDGESSGKRNKLMMFLTLSGPSL